MEIFFELLFLRTETGFLWESIGVHIDVHNKKAGDDHDFVSRKKSVNLRR